MEIIDSHIHWGPSVTMGVEVTTEELLRQGGTKRCESNGYLSISFHGLGR